MAIIQNIRQLKGAAVLADRTAQSPDLQCRQLNLLYGFNGSGKSTLGGPLRFVGLFVGRAARQ